MHRANLWQTCSKSKTCPESVRHLILKKAEGNPFYVEEVIRSLLDQKLVVRDGERWRATHEIANIAIPDTLAGVITARLDRLDEESRHTAQTASVLGREFEYAPLTELSGAEARLEPALDVLQARRAGTRQTRYGAARLSLQTRAHARDRLQFAAHEQTTCPAQTRRGVSGSTPRGPRE